MNYYYDNSHYWRKDSFMPCTALAHIKQVNSQDLHDFTWLSLFTEHMSHCILNTFRARLDKTQFLNLFLEHLAEPRQQENMEKT